MSKTKDFFNKVVLKFANTFSGPRLKVLITALVIFTLLGIAILTTTFLN